MSKEDIVGILGITVILGLLLALVLIIIDEGTVLVLINKLKCRFGKHKLDVKIGRAKIKKYYCKHCKKPRNHPKLKIVDGNK